MALTVAVGERSALSIAAPGLQDNLGISMIEVGWILSAFAWSYVAAHIPVGLIVEKYGTRNAIGLGILGGALTSLLIAMSGMSWIAGLALTTILVARVALGIAQAPVGASSGLVMSAWFPKTERGLTGAAFSSIPYLAVALLNPGLGFISEHYGWRAMFLGMAFISLVASILWFKWFYLPSGGVKLTAKERRKMIVGDALIGTTHLKLSSVQPLIKSTLLGDFRAVFFNRMMGGVVIAQYCINAITWFFLAWFPTYLVMTFNYSIAKAASVSAIPAIAGFLGGLVCGIFSDAILRKTHDLTKARKAPILLGIGLSSASFLACLFVEDDVTAISLMSIAFFGKGLGTLGWTLVADLAPANRVGFAGSVVNGVGNLSGIFTPVIVGYLIAVSQNFDLALVFMSLHGITAISIHVCMTGSLQRLPSV